MTCFKTQIILQKPYSTVLAQWLMKAACTVIINLLHYTYCTWACQYGYPQVMHSLQYYHKLHQALELYLHMYRHMHACVSYCTYIVSVHLDLLCVDVSCSRALHVTVLCCITVSLNLYCQSINLYCCCSCVVTCLFCCPACSMAIKCLCVSIDTCVQWHSVMSGCHCRNSFSMSASSDEFEDMKMGGYICVSICAITSN